MTGQHIQIKKTAMEPPAFRGAPGRVVRVTGHGYVVVHTADGREIILHPDSVQATQ